MNSIICSEAGNLENQDRAGVIFCAERLVLVVADGAGGRSGGAEAAEMTAKLVRENANRLTTDDDCVRLLREIDKQVSSDPVAGETTCVVAVVTRSSIVGASVGDSGAWFVTAKEMYDLTWQQARKPFVGCGAVRITPFNSTDVPAGTLLLATDGLLKYTSPERICEECRKQEVESAKEELLGLVRLQSGVYPDDVTFILHRL
jgi:serine/threonine protein phosphatase PrpC